MSNLGQILAKKSPICVQISRETCFPCHPEASESAGGEGRRETTQGAMGSLEEAVKTASRMVFWKDFWAN